MEIITLNGEILCILFFAGLLAGLVDSIAGGGGMIALPALLFVGLPPQQALGTLKLQGSFGTLSASYTYIKKGQASLPEAMTGILATLAGATGGSCLVQQMDPAFVKPAIPFMLLVVFLFTLFSKNLGYSDRKPHMSAPLFYLVFGVSLGFYDGFFGPGTGSFWTVAMMSLLGLNMTKATGYTKIMNFTSNFVALIWFIIGGNVCYTIGLVMAVGQLIGARVGASLAIHNGTRFIRPFFLTVIFVTIVRLIYINFTT